MVVTEVIPSAANFALCTRSTEGRARSRDTINWFFFVFFFSLSFLVADISGLSLIKGQRGTPIHSSFRQVSPLLTSPLRNFSVICCGLGKAALSPPRGSVGDYNS